MARRKQQPGSRKMLPVKPHKKKAAGVALPELDIDCHSENVTRRLGRIEANYAELDALLTTVESQLPKPEKPPAAPESSPAPTDDSVPSQADPRKPR